MSSRLHLRGARSGVREAQATNVVTTTANAAKTILCWAKRGQERASHHGIGGNLKRTGPHVNGYVWLSCKSVQRGPVGWIRKKIGSWFANGRPNETPLAVNAP